MSHGTLRRKLELYTENDPNFRDHESIILFRFIHHDNGADQVPARVTVTEDLGDTDQLISDTVLDLKKRSTPANSTLSGPGLTYEQLRAYVKAGNGYETLIHENSTVCWICCLKEMRTEGKTPCMVLYNATCHFASYSCPSMMMVAVSRLHY